MRSAELFKKIYISIIILFLFTNCEYFIQSPGPGENEKPTPQPTATPEQMQTATPTPTREPQEQTASPVFSLQEGNYTGIQSVTLSCSTQGAAIYYTQDGTIPDENSTQYIEDSTIWINASMTLKAIAFMNGLVDSNITSADYTISGVKTFTEKSTISLTGRSSSSEIFLDGNYSYISFNNGEEPHLDTARAGFSIVDISNPSAPAITGSFARTKSQIMGIVYKDNHVFVANDVGGVDSFDVTNKSAPVYRSTYTCFSLLFHLLGNTLFVSIADRGGLLLLDISNPAGMTKIGEGDTNGSNAAIFGDSNYAYVVNTGDAGNSSIRHSLRIFDVSTPSAPVLTGTYDNPHWVHDFVIKDNYLYLSCNGFGIEVIDISDKANPRKVKEFPVSFGIHNITSYENLLFFSDGNAIRIWDITDRLNPVYLGYKAMTGVHKMKADAEHLYVLNNDINMTIFSY